jgi:hypothetical protein
MKKVPSRKIVFLSATVIAAITMYLVGWRSLTGIAGASIAAGIGIALVARRSAE